MSAETKLCLLKQFLSQAELADRKAFAMSKADHVGVEANGFNECRVEGSDLEPPYKKSKILDALALQLAAVLKFNLNLFRTTYEIPIRLLARLYRVLVTVTAKNSTILQPLFEQADGKDNLFKVNPYARFDWRALHPTTIYAIFSYHVWCLQVSFASSMLPQPFRNLTPAVSGLTEVPDTVFFADNRVEVSVILERIAESVSQLAQISALSDEISLARPFPTAFPLVGPGLPPVLGAPLDVDVEERTDGSGGARPRQNLLIRDAEPLSKEYLELSIKFILGRHAFQMQNFSKAEELFTVTLNLMKQIQIDYAEEVGVTVHLLETYLRACQSCHPEKRTDIDLATVSSNPCVFVEAFCELLERDWIDSTVSERPSTPFWCQVMSECGMVTAIRSPNRTPRNDQTSTVPRPTCEDHLYQVLMEDLHVEDNTHPSELVVPLGCSLRQHLEQLCLRALIALDTTRSDVKASRQPPAKQPKLSPRIGSVGSTNLLTIVHHLYTKVRVCNVIERLVSESFAEPVQFATLLITAPERPSDTGRSQATTICSTPTLDPVCGWEFLCDCLDCFLHVLSTQPKQCSCVRIDLVNQFVLYIVQHGLGLLGQLDAPSAVDSMDLTVLRRRFRQYLRSLIEHDLFTALCPDVQTFIQSVFDSECDEESSINEVVEKRSYSPNQLPDPEIELPAPSAIEYGLASLANNFADSVKLGNTVDWFSDTSTYGEAIFGSKKDVDMRNTMPPFTPVPYAPYPSHALRPGVAVVAATSSMIFSNGPDSFVAFNGDASAMSAHASTVRLLQTTCSPSGVSMCVRKLISLWPAAKILEVNSAWIPCLRRLAALEIASTSGILNEKADDDPLTPFLSVDLNSVGLLIAAIELAKASLCLEHQTTSPNRVQTLLLAALSELTASTNTLCVTPSQLIWFRAALRHELLLLDLLGVLDPSSVISTSDSRGFGATNCPKSPARRLNDLSRRAKICLFHAAGLSTSASALENKMDASMPLGLSTMLVCSASCFLLWNGERDFLLPSSKRVQSHSGLPKGALPAHGSTLGALDLIRALLRLHEAVSVTAVLPVDPTDGPAKRDTTSAATVPGPDAETRPVQADRVKTAINNLWNLIVFGCLVPELANSNHGGSENNSGETKPNHGRSQIQLPTLVNVARMLACSSLTSGCDTDPDHLVDPKRRFGPSQGPRRPSPTLYLLTYLITCLAHITHAVCPEFQLPKVPAPAPGQSHRRLEPLDEDEAWVGKPGSHDSSDASAKPDPPESASVRRKRSRWDPTPDETRRPGADGSSESVTSAAAIGLAASSNLSDSRWPTEVPSSTKLPVEAAYDLLLLFVNAGLAVVPMRVDWLLLRAELEFRLDQPQAALRTYLEVCAIVTDCFIRPLPTSIRCEEIISRMVRICQSLGLLGEAVVLCQLAPDDSLIELGLQLISSVFSDGHTAATQPVEIGNPSNDANSAAGGQAALGASSAAPPPATGTTTTTVSSNRYTRARTSSLLLTERPRGACGGFLARNPWDCLDSLVDYLWNIRLLETLSANALIQGALGVHAKFNASLSLPELNASNRDEILQDGIEARTLDFLRWMADEHL